MVDETIWVDGLRHRLCSPDRAPRGPAAQRYELLDEWRAARVLRQGAREGSVRAHELFDGFGEARDLDGLDRTLTRALEQRRLLVLRERVSAIATGRRPAVDDPEDEGEGDTAWLELELVDAAGNALGSLTYEVELSDGSTRIGHLDDDGRASLRDIPRGACLVRFPDVESGELPAT